LENDLECSVEDLVQAVLFLGRANNEALECVLLGGSLDLSIGDTLSQLGFIATALKLFSQIQLGSNEDAGTGSCCGFDLTDPLLARILERIPLHQAEADDETVSVCIGNRAQATKILVTSCVPNLKLDFAAFVVFGTIVSIEYGGFIETWESFLGPGHDDGGFTHGSVTHKDELHVVFLVLIDQWFSLYHLQMTFLGGSR